MSINEVKIRELDYNEYDFYYADGFSHILPSLSTIGTFNFLSYCSHYSMIGDRLVHLPLRIIEKDYGPKQKYLAFINGYISEIVGKKLFYIEEVDEVDGNPVYTTELGLYLIYNAVSDIIYNDKELKKVLTKLFTGFNIRVVPNCKEGVLLGEKMFIDKNMERYEDSVATFGGDFFSHILLYQKLKENGYKPIDIKKHRVLQPSLETNENRGGKYTLAKHKKYGKMIKDMFNIQENHNLGDYFGVIIQENNFLLLGYILFNEFILGNHVILCYGDYLRFKAGPIFGDFFMINKDYLGDFIFDNSFVNCLTLINHSYQDIYSEKIEKIPIIKELRAKFRKQSNNKAEKESEPDLQKGRQDEVLKEIELIRTTTDSSEITVVVKHKEIKHMKSDFQVDDIERIKEIRDFTSQNGGAHIQNYDFGKRYIEGNRIKKIGGKKGKYDGKDYNEYI